MRPLRLALIPILTLGLGACATETPPDPALLAAAQRLVTCTAGADCEAKWSRAVAWIATHAHWKIQTQTSELIQTYGPVTTPVIDSVYAAFNVTKAADGEGQYRIEVETSCLNPFGCVPGIYELKAALVGASLGESR